MKRYFVLQDWMNNFWFTGKDPNNQDYSKDWGGDMAVATVFTEEQMGQHIPQRGESWQEIPNMKEFYGIPTH